MTSSKKRKIIVIGAGISGLSSGIYALKNGFECEIYESHIIPGGCCTSWKRGKFTINGCLHWLVGTKDKTPLFKMWKLLGHDLSKNVLYKDRFITFERENGKPFIVYTDLDKLEKHMLEIAPEDEELIRELCQSARSLTKLRLPIIKAKELMSFKDKLLFIIRCLPFLKDLAKWKKKSIQDYAQEFKNPFIREVFSLMYDFDDFSMLAVVLNMAWFHNKMSGYPLGGSLDFSTKIAEKFERDGGTIHYRQEVKKILISKGKAIGIKLSSGDEIYADIVISSADGRKTLYQMIGEEYSTPYFDDLYQKNEIFPPLFMYNLVVDLPFSSIPASILGTNFPLRKSVTIAGKENKRFTVKIYNFDDSLAPQDHSILKVMLQTDYDYWKNSFTSRKEYREKKEEIKEQILNAIEERFPNIKEHIKLEDTSTPTTFENYTHNSEGTFEGWIPKVSNFGKQINRTLPGVSNFYQAGHWLIPGGGVPTAAITGRQTIELICHDLNKRFLCEEDITT